MPLDAICLSAVKNELSGQITGMKIDKVQQPERDVIILSLRGNGGQTCRLLISAGADDARVHLTEFKLDNPNRPPMFCMLLRKHLTGARIIEVKQPPAERVISIRLETSDAMGDRTEKQLIIEMIGRLSSVILTDNDGIIIDCLRRIGGELTGKRSVLPGLLYRNPPAQEGKLNPLEVTATDFSALLETVKANRSDEQIDKWLISAFTAFSPLICREIVWRAYGETDFRIYSMSDDGAALQKAFSELISQAGSGSFEPWLISSHDKKPMDFSFTHIGQYENAYIAERESSFSALLDGYYTKSAQEKRIRQRSSATLKIITTARERLIRKLNTQRLELDETSKRDFYRECGDMITSNIHLLKKGQQLFMAEDYFSSTGGLREIKLDTLKTPQQNAAKYYKAYTKAKNAQTILTKQIENGEKELEYIESVIELIKRIENESDLNEIREELLATGYIKQKRTDSKEHKKGKKKHSNQKESSPHRFISTSGMRIYVGRNNMQNDRLTLKTAAKSDMWFHAQKIHGAHVVVSCAGSFADEKTRREAATLAAYYSAARLDSKVPVDYTFIKNVKKPSGGRPGMVIYNDYKTIITTPDENLVKQLRDDS